MNTGVQDVHNVAWKIAAVLQDWAGPGLLDSYDVERRPVARINADRSLENSRMVGRINRSAMEGGAQSAQAVAASRRYGNFTGMDLGFHYDRGALIDDGTPPPAPDDPVIDYLPTARPGHRAPHARLEREGREISTLDLFDGLFTLLAGSGGSDWRDTASRVAQSHGVPLHAFTVGSGAGATSSDLHELDRVWPELYGIGTRGAVLVRPDGHVAWRTTTGHADPRAEIDSVLRRILSRM
jgi:hypothetical protein